MINNINIANNKLQWTAMGGACGVSQKLVFEEMKWLNLLCKYLMVALNFKVWRNAKGFLILISFSEQRPAKWGLSENPQCKNGHNRNGSCTPQKLIKNPLGFLQSNPQILTEQVEPFLFFKNMFWWNILKLNHPNYFVGVTAYLAASGRGPFSKAINLAAIWIF